MPDRRSFLQGLTTLPLIGGGVTLVGNPTAAAVPVTDSLLFSYNEWLFYERRLLCLEHMGGTAMEAMVPDCRLDFHFPRHPSLTWREVPKPSTRAAAVLAAVGCSPGTRVSCLTTEASLNDCLGVQSFSVRTH